MVRYTLNIANQCCTQHATRHHIPKPEAYLQQTPRCISSEKIHQMPLRTTPSCQPFLTFRFACVFLFGPSLRIFLLADDSLVAAVVVGGGFLLRFCLCALGSNSGSLIRRKTHLRLNITVQFFNSFVWSVAVIWFSFALGFILFSGEFEWSGFQFWIWLAHFRGSCDVGLARVIYRSSFVWRPFKANQE